MPPPPAPDAPGPEPASSGPAATSTPIEDGVESISRLSQPPGPPHHRCAYTAGGQLELCDTEAQPRAVAFAAMVAAGDLDAAETMAANIERVVRVHLGEHELRERREGRR